MLPMATEKKKQGSDSSAAHPPKLVVVDGNSLLYRAFFALPALTTANGTPTNAVYGFTVMLMRLLDDERPDVILIAQEGGRTFRHDQYAEYKGQRPSAPSDLVVQSALARQVAEALRIPQVRSAGFEADDLVGTLACRGKAEGWDVLVVTGDLDLLQLVDDGVRVMVNRRGMTDTMVYDREAVRARFNLEPDQLPDFKALKGDPTDNIPGVPGIGEKTASKLIHEYGSLERLLEAAPDLPAGRVRDALLEHSQRALQYKALCTIVTDVPLDASLEAWRYPGPDVETARPLFLQLEFRTLARRLAPPEEEGAAVARPEGKLETDCCANPGANVVQAFTAAVGEAGRVAVRCRPGVATKRVSVTAGSAVSTGPQTLVFGHPAADSQPGEAADTAPASTPAPPLPDALAQVLRDGDVEVAAHDLKAELRRFHEQGVEGVRAGFDTLLAGYVLNPGRSTYRLADLAGEHLGVELAEGDDSLEALGREAAAVAQLWQPLDGRLRVEELDRVYYELELPLVPILIRMEDHGLLVDVDALRELSERLGARVEALQEEIYRLAGHPFNIGSPKQLQTVLFEELGFQVGKRTQTGLASTGVEVLEQLAAEHEIAARILDYREVAKLKSTYADALQTLRNPRTGRVHTTLNQTVAATGRLSSSEPNVQNIPIRSEIGREIRKTFIAPPGWRLLSADYSQIELRILAHVTSDPELVRAFREDEDIHRATAARVFGVEPEAVSSELRRRGKTLNFAVIYGMSDFGLSRQLQIPVAHAHEMITAYFARFPGVRRFTEQTIREARDLGYVTTLPPYGRKRYIPGINAGNRNERLNAERAAVNAPIQGTAADIIKRAMIRVDEGMQRLGFRSRMLLQVHDELLFEVLPEEEERLAALVRREMEAAGDLTVPLRADVKAGPNWRDLAPVGRGSHDGSVEGGG